MPPKLKSFLKFIGYTSLFITTCVAFIIGMAFYFFYAYSQEVYYKEKFDQKIWLNNKTRYYNGNQSWVYVSNVGCQRAKMVEDLMANYIKIGMTVDEIKKLLGETNLLRIYEGLLCNTKCLRYDLGSCEIGSSTSILLVCFDENQKVTKKFRSTANDSGKSEYMHLLLKLY